MKTIGTRIREKRQELGWTQEEAARWFEVSHCTVSRWETDKQKPTKHLRSRIETFLRFAPGMPPPQ